MPIRIAVFTSRVVPLPAENVDTDQIVPARYLKVTDKDGLADALFRDWRFEADGSLKDPPFVLDQPGMAGRRILLVGDNFGTGSSREHAPWALRAWGIRAILSTASPTSSAATRSRTACCRSSSTRPRTSACSSSSSTTPRPSCAVDLAEQGVLLPGRLDDRLRRSTRSPRRCSSPAPTRSGYLLGQEPSDRRLGGRAPGPRRHAPRYGGRLTRSIAGTRRRAAPSAGHDHTPNPSCLRPTGGRRDRHPHRRLRGRRSCRVVRADTSREPGRLGAAAPTPVPTPVPGSTDGGAPSPDDPVSGGGSDAGNTGTGGAGDPGVVDPGEPEPTLVTPGVGLTGVHPVGAPRSWTRRSTAATSRCGSPGGAGSNRASVLAGVDVDRDGDTFTLTVREGSAAAPDTACIEIAVLKATIVDLGELEPGTYTITAVGDAAPVTVTIDDPAGPDGPAAGIGHLADTRTVNMIDLLAVIVLVFAIYAGIRTGALPQVGGIAGAIGGLLLILALTPYLLDLTAGLDPIPRALVVLGTVLAAVIIGEAIGSGLGRVIAGQLRRGVLSSMDRVAGGFLGAVQALLVVWLVGGLLAAGPFPTLGRAATQSAVVRGVDQILPPPTEVVDEIAACPRHLGAARRVHRPRAAPRCWRSTRRPTRRPPGSRRRRPTARARHAPAPATARSTGRACRRPGLRRHQRPRRRRREGGPRRVRRPARSTRFPSCSIPSSTSACPVRAADQGAARCHSRPRSRNGVRTARRSAIRGVGRWSSCRPPSPASY